MIGAALLSKLPGIGEKVMGLVENKQKLKARKTELKFEAQKMQHSYLKEKVSIGLFTFVAITVIMPFFFYSLSPFLKYIPFMTEILTDYEEILNTITLDRVFKVVFALLGMGGLATSAAVVGRVKMASKKADNDAAIKKVEIKSTPKKAKITYAKDCSDTLSNSNTFQMVKALSNELHADKIIITGADRSRIAHNRLIKSGATSAPYEKTQHGRKNGYKAADIKAFKNEKQIPPLEVAKSAESMAMIGGVGVYKTFTHVDIRDRKKDGSCAKWGDWV